MTDAPPPLDTARIIATFDHHVRVAGLDDIIDSKRWANRPKDHDALPELETLAAQGRDYREPCDDVGDAPELA